MKTLLALLFSASLSAQSMFLEFVTYPQWGGATYVNIYDDCTNVQPAIEPLGWGWCFEGNKLLFGHDIYGRSHEGEIFHISGSWELVVGRLGNVYGVEGDGIITDVVPIYL